MEGFTEAFDTAEKTEVKLQISHAVPKYGAPSNAADWLIDQMEVYYRKIDMACDVIPYCWSPTSISIILPKELLKYEPLKIAELLKDRDVRKIVKNQN